ncbi:DNA-binding transcriptional LysR family regulator [Paenibacillus sp. DS2015]
MKIILKPGLCLELLDKVCAGELDLAFLLQPEIEDKVIHVETIVHTEAGCTYRMLFEQYLNSQGVFPDPSLEFWNIEAIKQCVMAGLGISFLPLVTVQDELNEGKLSKLVWNDENQRVATQIAYHTKKWQSPALSEFISVVQKHAIAWRKSTHTD